MKETHYCLLIDDDPEDQEIFLMALSEISEDIRCDVAGDGLQGLKKLSDNPAFLPDYIFLDVNMPRMNGLKCLEKLRELEYLNHTRVYMYSTSADPTVIAASRKLGADDYLVKPPGFSALVQKLTHILT